MKAIEEYLASPAPGTVLALVAEELKKDAPLDEGSVAKRGTSSPIEVPKRNVAQWIAERFKLAGARAEPEACAALLELVGDDFQQLANEVDKLATWAAGEPIGEREVELLVAARRRHADLRAHRRLGAARRGAHARRERDDLRARGQVAARHGAPRSPARSRTTSCRVRQCQRLAAEGVRPREAAGTLKMHPFYAEKVFAQAANFSEDELRDAVVRLAALDLGLKGKSKLTPDLELQRALVDLGRERLAS